jgi:hypothetical protein
VRAHRGARHATRVPARTPPPPCCIGPVRVTRAPDPAERSGPPRGPCTHPARARRGRGTDRGRPGPGPLRTAARSCRRGRHGTGSRPRRAAAESTPVAPRPCCGPAVRLVALRTSAQRAERARGWAGAAWPAVPAAAPCPRTDSRGQARLTPRGMARPGPARAPSSRCCVHAAAASTSPPPATRHGMAWQACRPILVARAQLPSAAALALHRRSAVPWRCNTEVS